MIKYRCRYAYDSTCTRKYDWQSKWNNFITVMGAMLIGTSLARGLKEMTSVVIVFCIAMSLVLLAIGPVLRMQIKKVDVVNREEMTNSLVSK